MNNVIPLFPKKRKRKRGPLAHWPKWKKEVAISIGYSAELFDD